MVDIGVDHVGSVLVSEQAWKNPVLKSTIQQVQALGRKSSLIPLFRQIDLIAEAVLQRIRLQAPYEEARAEPGPSASVGDEE